MSHLQYTQEKARLLSSGASVLFTTDPPPPSTSPPLLLIDKLHFTIYPTTPQHLATNDLLWHLCQKRTFTSHELSPLLPPTVTPFAIALTPPLARFLTSVTFTEMHAAVIYMLADAAQGEDALGLAKMQAELPNCIWKKLTSLMEVTAMQRSIGWGSGDGCSPGITRASFLLDAALQTAPSNDYWKISVDVACAELTTPRAVEVRLAHGVERAGRGVRQAEGKAKWALILQSLYEDWRRYVAVCGACVQETRYAAVRRDDEDDADARYRQAQELLTSLVSSNRQMETWDKVDVLQVCAEERSSFFSWLPSQIVQQVLIPAVLIQDGEQAKVELGRRGVQQGGGDWLFS